MKPTERTTQAEMTVEYQRLEKAYSGMSAREALAAMSDDELFAYLVIKTIGFGRTLAGAVDNARVRFAHEARAEIEKSFLTHDFERGIL